MNKPTSVALIDIEGYELSAEDRDILSHPAVAGVILFSKNYDNISQLKSLTQNIQTINPALFITVDQEGGRVQRFREGFTELPAMREWGEKYKHGPQECMLQFVQVIETMVMELQSVGVQSTLAPVLDLDYGISDIIGERSFSRDPNVVTILANVVVSTLHRCGMPVVAKHFPGHGHVVADSHLELPIDSRPFNEIEAQDMVPYQQLLNTLDGIMPAHVVYDQCDDLPACFSSFWLTEVLRKKFGFDGVIISDDLSMEAAVGLGDYESRADQALKAGCDFISICNNREGTVSVLESLESRKNRESEQRIKKFISRIKTA